LPASRLARTFGRAANGRDAVMKVGHLLDQLAKLRHDRFDMRQWDERAYNHVTVAGGLTLIAETQPGSTAQR
jgi:hypothetical protein